MVSTADIGFGGEYDMISRGEVDHPFVNDFDDSVSFGAIVSSGPVRPFNGATTYGNEWSDIYAAYFAMDSSMDLASIAAPLGEGGGSDSNGQ